MKKITFIFGIFLFLALAVNAQAPLQKGEKQLNAGFGLSNYGLPVYGGLEIGMGNNISVGGELSYRGSSESITTYKYKHSILSVAGIANYHFNEVLDIPSNWDFYAGLSLGFTNWSSKFDGAGAEIKYSGSGNTGLNLSAQIGGRYFFSDTFGVNLEFGGGNQFNGGKVGITVLL